MVKSFHQQPELDYGETFSPVIKPTTVRTVCSLADSKGWSIRQLNVNNTFLQGFLTDGLHGTTFGVHQFRSSQSCLQGIYSLKQAREPGFLASVVI